MTLAAGSRLGPYEILSPLGAGGMGEVYKARDTRLGREVALKVLPEALAQDRDRLSRFEQEARAASALNHPNIVTVHDIGREGATEFIAMELVDGKTVRELEAAGSMPLRKILSVAAQIAEGLAKAHAAGIVHRDLKPENVMVSKDGFVKILDFGLAKLVEPESGDVSAMPTLARPETHPGTVMGTVAYMSPEQASGEPLDFRSDQFSLGSILYEMSTGQKAFQKKTSAETMSAIIRDEPEPLGKLRPELPLALRWMVERCLAKEPEERYASTRDLARDLASMRDHISEVTSASEVLPATTARPRRRLRMLTLGLAALAIAAAAGWLVRGRLAAPPSAPRFTRLTFRKGQLLNARFAPDGQTIIYGAQWDRVGSAHLFQTRVGSPESGRFDFAGDAVDILAISRTSELALLLGAAVPNGATLARVAMSGGTPRQVLEGVAYAGADFSPDGSELAVAHLVDGESRLELPLGKVLVPEGADRPRFSPDGRSIAFLDSIEGGTAVSVIDRQGGAKRVVSKAWADIAGAPCWRPDGREIWVTATEHEGEPAALWAVETGKRRLLMRVPGSLELDDLSRDGRVLLAHHTTTRTVRLASVGEPKDRELSWLDNSWVADLSSDGKTLLLTESGEGSGGRPVSYLRGTDGSPALKLGEGWARTLSPDGKWVLSAEEPAGRPSQLVILPTGPGEARMLPTDGLTTFHWGTWLPDGKAIVYTGEGRDGINRLYSQALPDGKPRAISPDRTRLQPFSNPISPDGRYVVALHAGRVLLYPVDGGDEARAVPGLSGPGDRVLQWSIDGHSLYVQSRMEGRSKIWLVDVATGQKSLWREIPIDEELGYVQIRVTPDGKTWVHSGTKILSELYVVEGLR
jgi:eukaryotic-like serine/threonine-protein kinase